MNTEDIPNINIEELPIDLDHSTIKVDSLLSCTGDLGLTEEETRELEFYTTANNILGPAAGSVLLCPGNQLESDTDSDTRCPYWHKCPLRRMKKAPKNKLCPIEKSLVEQRFSAWCKEIGKSPDDLSESERSVVADLTWIDLQVQRCVNILSAVEESRLMHKNVTEAILLDPTEPPITITSEKILHSLTTRLDQLLVQRRALQRDWMLTPEQKFKLLKLSTKTSQNNQPNNKNFSISQTEKADILRQLDKN